MSNPTTFDELYPAPWRISTCGEEVQDAQGRHVNAFDGNDPDARLFWEGVIAAVNRGVVIPPRSAETTGGTP